MYETSYASEPALTWRYHMQLDRAIEIAVQHGYTTPEQREKTEKMLHKDDCCDHGLDPQLVKRKRFKRSPNGLLQAAKTGALTLLF